MPRRSILLFAGACIAVAVALAIVTVVVVGGRGGPSNGAEIASPEWAQHSAPRYLNYRKTSIYGGSNEVQRTIISSTILGL